MEDTYCPPALRSAPQHLRQAAGCLAALSSSGDWHNDGSTHECAVSQRAVADLLMLRQRCERHIERLHEQLAEASREEKVALLEELSAKRAELQALRDQLVPDTTGDILSGFVNVFMCERESAGFQELVSWLGMAPEAAPQTLHCAQTVHGTWRILDDPNGVEVQARPPGFTTCVPMSLCALAERGLHPVKSHRIISSRYLVDFRDVATLEHAQNELNHAMHLFRTLKEEGWQVDTAAYLPDEQQLSLVKSLAPLKTLQDEAAAEAHQINAGVMWPLGDPQRGHLPAGGAAPARGRRSVSQRASDGGDTCAGAPTSSNRSAQPLRRAARTHRRRGPQGSST